MPLGAAFLSLPTFQGLLANQASMATRAQLAAAGATGHHLANRFKNNSWQAIGPHVVALHNGPLSEEQRLWVAVLHAGPDSALGGLTAAIADGLTGFASQDLIAVAPHGRNRDDLRLAAHELTVRVHESRHLAADLHPARLPPRTRLPRSIVDAASTAPSDGQRRALIAAAIQQRLTTASLLRTVARRRRTLHHHALILETIDDVEGGSHSLPELEWASGIRTVGLPEPTRQRSVRRRNGLYYLDAEFDPFRVTVEINGSGHLSLIQKEYDDVRRTRLSIGGRLVVDLSSYTVRRHNDLAMLLTADALLSRGWKPDSTVWATLTTLAARHPFSWTSQVV
jgi:hypothetical protein